MTQNITPLNLNFRLQPFDLNVIRSRSFLMLTDMTRADVLHSQTGYLPHPYQKFKQLNLAMGQQRQRLGESSARVIISIESFLTEVRDWNEQAESTSDAERLDHLDKLRSRSLDKALKTVRNEIEKLQSGLQFVNQHIDMQSMEAFASSLEQRVAGFVATENEQAAQLSVLVEKRTTLSQAIDALQETGFTKIGQNALLTAEKVLELGLKPSVADVIILGVKLGIEQMKASLVNAEAGFNYLTMVKQRDALRLQIDALRQKQAGAEQEKQMDLKRIELIGCFRSMREHNAAYLEQYGNIVTTVENFAAANAASYADENERRQRFITSGIQLISYLQPLR